jgi:hypothetical protein
MNMRPPCAPEVSTVVTTAHPTSLLLLVRSFDLGVLQLWASALRQPRLKQLLLQQPGNSWACIDTLQVVKKVQQLQNRTQRPDAIAKLQKVNLQALREHFGIEKNNAHRCVGSYQVCLALWANGSRMGLQFLQSCSYSAAPG